MPIKSTTVYTEDRLLKHNKYVISSFKTLTILMIVCTLVIIGLNIACLAYGIEDTDMTESMLTVLLFDIVYVCSAYILPRFIIKKRFNLNATNIYTFYEDHFTIFSNTAYSSENGTVKYTVFKKVEKNDTDMYMFIDRLQAYIVDISALTEDEINTLKGIFENYLPKKKIKWK